MKTQRLTLMSIIALLLVSSIVCTFPGIAKTTATPEPEAVQFSGNLGGTGSISGNLSYPSDFIPAMRVVAMRIENDQPTGEYVSIDTGRNTQTYSISGLASGGYWVVAYPIEDIGQSPSLAGGYTQAVVCGLDVNCTDHSLILVEVKDGDNTPGINPGDWNAPAGTLPKDPSR